MCQLGASSHRCCAGCAATSLAWHVRKEVLEVEEASCVGGIEFANISNISRFTIGCVFSVVRVTCQKLLHSKNERQREHPPRKLGGVGTSHYRLSVTAATVQTSTFNVSNHTTQHSRTQTPAGPSHNRGDDITSVCCEPEQTTPPSLVPSRVLHALAQSVPPTQSCSHMAPHLPFSARHRAC